MKEQGAPGSTEAPLFFAHYSIPGSAQTRLIICYNGGETYVFAWDSDLRRLSAIGDGTAEIPEELEEAISVKLQQLAAKRLPQLS